MRKILATVGALGFLAAAPIAHASVSPHDFALGVGVGTEGIGGQLSTQLIRHTLDFNIGVSRFSHHFSFTADSTKFGANLRLGGEPVGVSWYPFHNGFKIEGGVLINANHASVTGQPNSGSTYTINGRTYTASQVGTMHGDTNFRTAAPYVGVGYGDPFAGGRWTFSVNAGVVFEGKPNVTLTASNASNNAQLQKDIQAEQTTVNNKLQFLQFWPEISIGLTYRF